MLTPVVEQGISPSELWASGCMSRMQNGASPAGLLVIDQVNCAFRSVVLAGGAEPIWSVWNESVVAVTSAPNVRYVYSSSEPAQKRRMASTWKVYAVPGAICSCRSLSVRTTCTSLPSPPWIAEKGTPSRTPPTTR